MIENLKYRLKYNQAKNELEYAKQSFAESLKRVGEIIIEKEESVDYYKKLANTRWEQIKRLKEENKMLKGRKSNGRNKTN